MVIAAKGVFYVTVSGMADTVQEYKMRFAQLLHRTPKDKRFQSASVIAKQVVGKEMADKFPVYVIKMAEELPYDPEVIAEVDRLDLIPITKEEILKDVYSMYVDAYQDSRVKLAALRLYSDINGWTKVVVDKSVGVPNEFLEKLQQLHTAVKSPVDT